MTILTLVLSVALLQAPVDTPYVITNVTVLPMDSERVLRAQSVVIQRGIITDLGPTGAVPVPAGARTIDGTGKYLMPGLVDVHVHLSYNSLDEQRDLLKLFLANGVTTVVNLRGTPQMLELRAAIAAGQILGPRFYTVGPYINEPFVTTPDEVERAVVEQKEAGYDFVKLHGSLSRDSYHRLNEVARRVGIRVVGHAPRSIGVEAMFAERQYMIAHGEEFLYDTLNRSTDSSLAGVEAKIPGWARATAAAKIWLTPNLTAFKAIARQSANLDEMLARPEMRYLPARVRDSWGPATNVYSNRFPKIAGSGDHDALPHDREAREDL